MARTLSYPPIAQLVERETVDGAVLTQPSLGPEFESQLGDFNRFFCHFSQRTFTKVQNLPARAGPRKLGARARAGDALSRSGFIKP